MIYNILVRRPYLARFAPSRAEARSRGSGVPGGTEILEFNSRGFQLKAERRLSAASTKRLNRLGGQTPMPCPADARNNTITICSRRLLLA